MYHVHERSHQVRVDVGLSFHLLRGRIHVSRYDLRLVAAVWSLGNDSIG